MGVSQRVGIYVAHQDPLVRQTLTDFLGELGHTATGGQSTADLLSQLKSRPTRLVLVELALLGLSCVDVLRTLHEQYPEVVFVLITSGGVLPAGDALACGVNAYLREPIRLRELELLVTRQTEHYAVSTESRFP